jgi:hypothetical protein
MMVHPLSLTFWIISIIGGSIGFKWTLSAAPLRTHSTAFVIESSGDEHYQFLLFSHWEPPFFRLHLRPIRDSQMRPDWIMKLSLLRIIAIIQ